MADVSADIYFSYTGKTQHRRHWSECSEKSQAALRQTAVDLLIDLRERYSKAAVWVGSKRVQVTEVEKTAYYERVKELLAREAAARAADVGEEVDKVLDDWEAKGALSLVGLRKRVRCRKSVKKKWRLGPTLIGAALRKAATDALAEVADEKLQEEGG